MAGLDPALRERDHMLMLQACFDDSGSDAQSPLFVLGGFLCSTEKWKQFSVNWRYILQKEPRLDYFKMAEAWGLRGQFGQGWNPKIRDQRVFELADLIREYDPVRIDSTLLRADFDYFRQGLPGGAWSDPYFICFYSVVRLCLEYLSRQDEKTLCDFVFDEQGEVGRHAVGWWRMAKLLAGQKLAEGMGSEPSFTSDKKFLPLQAADLYAWQIRHFLQAQLQTSQLANDIAMRFSPLKHLVRLIAPDDLLSLRQAAIAAMRGI
jgi:hypothetical protein